jgi:hypothetical protein
LQEGIVDASYTYNPKTAKLNKSGYIKLSSINDLIAGQDYTIRNMPNYVFQGVSDGIFIFNQKDLETGAQPMHIKEIDVNQMISLGEITH